jgi:hypothetical protein
LKIKIKRTGWSASVGRADRAARICHAILANLHLLVTKFSSAKSLMGALDQTQVRYLLTGLNGNAYSKREFVPVCRAIAFQRASAVFPADASTTTPPFE